MTIVCRTNAWGAGCGHPVANHDQRQMRPCCCCSGRHNDPRHVQACDACTQLHRERRVRMGWEEDA